MVALALVACVQTPASIFLGPPDDKLTHDLTPLSLPSATVMSTSGGFLEDPQITWTVTPTSVARIDGHDLVPLADGSATVEARCGDAHTSFAFVVSLPDAIGFLEVPAYVELGSPPARVQAVVSADGVALADAPITWTSETPSVATVDAAGQITPLAAGTARISAHSGPLTDTFEVPVHLSQEPDNRVISQIGDDYRVGVPEWRMTLRPDLAVAAPPSTVAVKLVDVTESFDGERKVVQKNVSQLKYCVEMAAKQKPAIAGQMTLRADVAAGRVTVVEVLQDGIGVEELSPCLVSKVKRWAFPPEGSGPVTFSVQVTVPAP